MKVFLNDDKTHGFTMTFCEGWKPTVNGHQKVIRPHNFKMTL